jgi:hypothetical protein
MKKVLLALAICLFIISCKTEDKKVENNNEISVEEIVETPLLTLGEFDTKAGEFIGKEIQVKGIVDHVCKHGGKKILLVTDDGDAHVFSEERFDEALMGSEIIVNGVVLEERIDESYCLKMEEDNIKSHSEGVSNKEQFENKKKHVQELRDQMKEKGVDHISNYSLQYVSLTKIEVE